jgi:hypothetical protein
MPVHGGEEGDRRHSGGTDLDEDVHRAVVDHLDLLVSAFGDYVVASRLASDLATYSRERDQPGNDNVFMYGVSPDCVKSKIARRTDAAAHRLAHLVAAQVLPAVELIRDLEYATTFY